MHQTPYVYNRMESEKYSFVSEGRQDIVKGVFFSPFIPGVLYNLEYGDLKKDGDIDDMTVSNNGDIIRIFATIIDIVHDFTGRNPLCRIHFSGSTAQRTGLYRRILRTYYQYFSQKFLITAYRDAEKPENEEFFDPLFYQCYLGFFIEKIN